MGLKSLPQVNRSGIYDFWENSWESKFLYKNYFYLTYTLQFFFIEMFNFFFFKYLFKIKGFRLGYSVFFRKESKVFFKFYFSKVWILKYQNWFVLVTYYYNLTPYLKKKFIYTQAPYKYNSILKIHLNYNFKF